MADKITVTVVCTVKGFDTLKHVIAMSEQLSDERFDVAIKAEKGRVTENRPPAIVQYRATAAPEVLDAMKAGTVNAIIFSHLLSGPLTVKDLMAKTHFTVKSVESALHKMRNFNPPIVESVKIEAAVEDEGGAQ